MQPVSLESRLDHHRNLAAWITVSQVSQQHIILHRHACLVHHHTPTPQSQPPCPLLIFKIHKNTIAFYDKLLHLSHEVAFLSINVWRSATTWLRFDRKLAFFHEGSLFLCLFRFFYTIVSLGDTEWSVEPRSASRPPGRKGGLLNC